MDLSGWDLSVMHLDSNFLSFSMLVVCRVDHIVALFFYVFVWIMVSDTLNIYIFALLQCIDSIIKNSATLFLVGTLFVQPAC